MPKQMSKEVKERIAAAQRQRWAAKKATAPVPPDPPTPAAPPPPNPTVTAFQQQLVPLVEKREVIQQHVRQSQRELQQAQMALAEHQQALADTENAIQYRLNMIAQLTGQPQQMPMPTMPMQVDRLYYARINAGYTQLRGLSPFPPTRVKYLTSAATPTSRHG